MTPAERERVKASLQAYLEQHKISVHDLARRINAEGKKVDPKTLHRVLERRLQAKDASRRFLDRRRKAARPADAGFED